MKLSVDTSSMSFNFYIFLLMNSDLPDSPRFPCRGIPILSCNHLHTPHHQKSLLCSAEAAAWSLQQYFASPPTCCCCCCCCCFWLVRGMWTGSLVLAGESQGGQGQRLGCHCHCHQDRSCNIWNRVYLQSDWWIERRCFLNRPAHIKFHAGSG